MKLETFELERRQSKWEHMVEINLTESGVSPVTLGELLDDPKMRPYLFDMPLGYPQTNGTEELRGLIASMYPMATSENILITNGGAEANFITMWNRYLETGRKGELITLLPNYMQIHGVWKNLGGKIIPFYLKMQNGKWVPDIEQLKEIISSKTAAVAICTPNNPTGAIISEEHLRALAEITYDAGAWLVSDEIYRGAELNGPKAPSAFSLSEKVIVTSSLSKSYGLPGLRIGWIASSDPRIVEQFWAYSDYTSICPSKLSDFLATIALEKTMRDRLEKRARERVRSNWHVMQKWLDEHSDFISYIPPQAAAICFPQYDLEIGSIELVERLRIEKDVLVVPGSHFGMDSYLRIGFGYDVSKLKEGLRRLDDLFRTLAQKP
ncbi:MAG: aminotransferase class I/II-fold pyridoxal phosphate-dependent enzyme [Candidatus Thorarchaeota archaeon]